MAEDNQQQRFKRERTEKVEEGFIQPEKVRKLSGGGGDDVDITLVPRFVKVQIHRYIYVERPFIDTDYYVNITNLDPRITRYLSEKTITAFKEVTENGNRGDRAFIDCEYVPDAHNVLTFEGWSDEKDEEVKRREQVFDKILASLWIHGSARIEYEQEDQLSEEARVFIGCKIQHAMERYLESQHVPAPLLEMKFDTPNTIKITTTTFGFGKTKEVLWNSGSIDLPGSYLVTSIIKLHNRF